MPRRGPSLAVALLAAFALCASACGDGDSPLDAAAVDLRIVPKTTTCRSKDSSVTCAVGEFCITFEGGGLRCQELPAACLERTTCACQPPLPNGTCRCSDDGAGRIIVDCH